MPLVLSVVVMVIVVIALVAVTAFLIERDEDRVEACDSDDQSDFSVAS